MRGVDLRVSEGEIFGFLGPNGAGKSTIVRMLCTLLPPTAGAASVAGHDVVDDGDEVRRSIGVALQEIGLDPVQTGRELLELQCGLYGIHRFGGARAGQRAARAGRADRRRRPAHQDLLRRDEAAAGPRQRARPPAEGALPRRADDRPRPRLPVDRLGGGAQHQRDGHDDLPHDAVPGGGGRALRAAGDHRRRRDRRRGHAREAQGRARQRCRHGRAQGRRSPSKTQEAIGELPGLERVDRRRRTRSRSTSRTARPRSRRSSGGSHSAGVEVGAISVDRPSLDDVFLEATGRRLEGAAEGEDVGAERDEAAARAVAP